MMMNRIARQFNRASDSYDANAHLQKMVGEKLIRMLNPMLFLPQSIIDLGCGTGTVTEKLYQQYPAQHFYAIDSAERLLNKAQNKLSHFPLQMLHSDFDLFFPANQAFDLIFSNMALHWSLQFEKTLMHIKNNLSDQGVFAFSIPLHGTFSEMTTPSKNDFYLEEKLLERLVLIGFKHITHETHFYKQLFDDGLTALRSIKDIGANCLKKATCDGLRGKRYLSHLLSSPSLTYHIGYFLMRKN